MMRRLTLVLSVVLLGLVLSSGTHGEIPFGAAEATFLVTRFDVGAAALEGRPGVISVEKGWRGTSEMDHVVYDPEKVTAQEMEGWLRKGGTYVRTVRQPAHASPG